MPFDSCKSFFKPPMVFGLTLATASMGLAQSSAAAPAAVVSQLAPVVVTGNLLEADLFELTPAVSVLSGESLMFKRQGTLGETLSGLPGVSASYFGPNASRPIIRGLDSDRIRVLQNGIGMLDVSALSNDHATSIDPLFIDRVEVVRGPAALLYGGSAVGGVVNVIDRRIVQAPLDGATGSGEMRIGGAEGARSFAGMADMGNGQIAMHLDFFDRKTRDLRISGYARSERQRAIDDPALDQPKNLLPNSASDARGGAVSVSLTGERGYAGLSLSRLENNYGTVAEESVTIRMKQNATEFAGELNGFGSELDWLKEIKLKAGYTDYQHTEFDDGQPATTFYNKGYEARVDAIHHKLGPFEGAFGLQLDNTTFSALGAEAFVPQAKTRSQAAFVFEELPLGDLKLNAGARLEMSSLKTDGGGPVDVSTSLPRFGNGASRDFTASSLSLGALYKLTPSASLVFNAASTQRAPTYYELFANGVHAATGGYEIGNTNFSKEKSHALEAALRVNQGPLSASLAAYRTRFSNYIGVFATGNTRGADGEINPVEDLNAPGVALSGEDILTEYRYAQVAAVFTGFELEGKARLLDSRHKLDLELGADQVRAENETTGEPLPRIPPLRYKAALVYANGSFGSRLEMIHAQRQNRVPSGELPTDAYTLLNANLSYRFVSSRNANQVLTLFVRANNLTNKEARSASSFLRATAPLPGRSIQLGLRGDF